MNKHKFLLICLILLLLVTSFISGYLLNSSSFNITGNSIVETSNNVTNKYSWTTALCSTDHFCMDVYVECNGKEILSVSPISSMVLFDENWTDPRKEHILCPHY